MGWLDGKRALVVGAGSGIGRAVVDAFAAEGARVAAMEVDPAKCSRLAAERTDCMVQQGDATVFPDAQAVVGACVAGLGGIDVLVNCVGIFDFYRGLADIDTGRLDDAFDEMFRVNVKSQLVCVKAALDELRRARGSVILTVSTSGFYPGRGGILYVASKFAVRGCVIALAHELAPEVRVNGVAPGGTLGTELTGLASLGLDDRRLDAAPGREEDLKRRTPLNVALTGADHAGSYVFLGLGPRPRHHRHHRALRRRRRPRVTRRRSRPPRRPTALASLPVATLPTTHLQAHDWIRIRPQNSHFVRQNARFVSNVKLIMRSLARTGEVPRSVDVPAEVNRRACGSSSACRRR